LYLDHPWVVLVDLVALHKVASVDLALQAAHWLELLVPPVLQPVQLPLAKAHMVHIRNQDRQQLVQ
jgi:hypothetical protein